MACFLPSTYLLSCSLRLLEREECRPNLTTAVTAAAAATAAATLVMSTPPQVKPRAQALLVRRSCVICQCAVFGPCDLPGKAMGSVGLLGNASLLGRGLRDFAFLKLSHSRAHTVCICIYTFASCLSLILCRQHLPMLFHSLHNHHFPRLHSS